MMSDLVLNHGLAFADLYDRDGLVHIDRVFVAGLAEADPALHDRLMTARRDPDGFGHPAESDLVVDLAPHVEDFLGALFGISAEIQELQARHHQLAPLYSVKRVFVQRRAVKGIKEADAAALDGPGLAEDLDALLGGPVDGIAAWERRYSEYVARWLDDEAGNTQALGVAQRYAAWATLSPEGQRSTGTVFCSRCRSGSTRTVWCRSRPSSMTAWRCCGCRKRNGGTAKVLR